MNKTNHRSQQLSNYIRVHRRNAGISQDELGRALGYRDADTVARHERFAAIPPLEVAISYEVVFRVPITEIFAGLKADIEAKVESRLAEFEGELGERSLQETNAEATARKLMWLQNRKEPITSSAHEG